MTATKKFNRVGSSILAVVIVAINLAAVANLNAAPVDKKLYDHSRVKNLDEEDARHIVKLLDEYNNDTARIRVHLNSKQTMLEWQFFDNLQAIDEATARALANYPNRAVHLNYAPDRGWIDGLFLGTPSINDKALEELVETAPSKLNPLKFLVFNRLKTLDDSQACVLLKWRGATLVVPDTVKIDAEAETRIHDNYRTWDFYKLPKSEIADFRKQLVEKYEGE